MYSPVMDTFELYFQFLAVSISDIFNICGQVNNMDIVS